MEITNILQNAPQKTRATKISENVLEIDYGVKLHGWEEFQLNFVSEYPRTERISSYKKDNHILVFYISADITTTIKAFDITRSLSQSTTVFHDIGITDVSAIMKLL